MHHGPATSACPSDAPTCSGRFGTCEREGAIELNVDPVGGIAQTGAAYPTDPDSGQIVPSHFLGEAGILLVLWSLTGSSQAAGRLYASFKSNSGNPTNDALWAASGTLVPARHL
jgi:hypothetical protein